MKISHRLGISIYGGVWLLVGIFLLAKGLSLLVVYSRFYGFSHPPQAALIKAVLAFVRNVDQAALILVSLGLLLGLIKGRTVLKRACKKAVARLRAIEEPLSFRKLFSPSYLLIMCLMVCLGLSLRFFSCPFDLRGVIDVAVGSGLIQGAMIYFREAIELKKNGKA